MTLPIGWILVIQGEIRTGDYVWSSRRGWIPAGRVFGLIGQPVEGHQVARCP